jgi:hypothetical protein
MLLVLFLLPVVTLVAVLTYGFVVFDRLVRVEYEEHRVTWENDGRPNGFFWRAKECNLLTSGFARMRLSFFWLFNTPTWVASSPPLVTKFRCYRLAVLAWNVGILTWLISARRVVYALHN